MWSPCVSTAETPSGDPPGFDLQSPFACAGLLLVLCTVSDNMTFLNAGASMTALLAAVLLLAGCCETVHALRGVPRAESAALESGTLENAARQRKLRAAG